MFNYKYHSTLSIISLSWYVAISKVILSENMTEVIQGENEVIKNLIAIFGKLNWLPHFIITVLIIQTFSFYYKLYSYKNYTTESKALFIHEYYLKRIKKIQTRYHWIKKNEILINHMKKHNPFVQEGEAVPASKLFFSFPSNQTMHIQNIKPKIFLSNKMTTLILLGNVVRKNHTLAKHSYKNQLGRVLFLIRLRLAIRIKPSNEAKLNEFHEFLFNECKTVIQTSRHAHIELLFRIILRITQSLSTETIHYEYYRDFISHITRLQNMIILEYNKDKTILSLLYSMNLHVLKYALTPYNAENFRRQVIRTCIREGVVRIEDNNVYNDGLAFTIIEIFKMLEGEKNIGIANLITLCFLKIINGLNDEKVEDLKRQFKEKYSSAQKNTLMRGYIIFIESFLVGRCLISECEEIKKSFLEYAKEENSWGKIDDDFIKRIDSL